MGPRYELLGDFLAGLHPRVTRVALTLREIEALANAPLPHASRTAPWWANTPHLDHARAWLEAGWRVAERSLRSPPPTITFVRADTTAQPTVRTRPSAPQAGRARRRG